MIILIAVPFIILIIGLLIYTVLFLFEFITRKNLSSQEQTFSKWLGITMAIALSTLFLVAIVYSFFTSFGDRNSPSYGRYDIDIYDEDRIYDR